MGDSGVISAVAGNPNAIGFASDGLVHATGSGVTAIAFQGIGQNLAVTPSTVGGKTSTIGLGITGTYSGASAARSGYVAWRPFQYVTTGVPTGETQVFINYVLDPENNQNIAAETGELSIYNA